MNFYFINTINTHNIKHIFIFIFFILYLSSELFASNNCNTTKITRKIVENEFIILVKEEHTKEIEKLVDSIGYKIHLPLGKWVHIVPKKNQKKRTLLGLNSTKINEQINELARIKSHEKIFTAQHNSINIKEFIACYPYSEDEKTKNSLPIKNSDKKITTDKKSTKSVVDKPKIVVPNDKLYSKQWNLHSLSNRNRGTTNMEKAWSLTQGSFNNTIAVIDSGFNHEILKEYYIDQKCKKKYLPITKINLDFTNPVKNNDKLIANHATGISLILGDCTNDKKAIAGLDWHAKILPIDAGQLTVAETVAAALWAVGFDLCNESIVKCPQNTTIPKNKNLANILNQSLGALEDEFVAYGVELYAINEINKRNGIVVSAAGNDAKSASLHFPSSHEGVIAVGANDQDGNAAEFTNFGVDVDILAPGVEILSINKNGDFEYLHGTSLATPQITGIASLIKSIAPNISWKQALYFLKNTARKMSCDQYCPKSYPLSSQKQCIEKCCDDNKTTLKCASGIVDAYNALLEVKNYAGIPPAALVDASSYYEPLYEGRKKVSVNIKNTGGVEGYFTINSSELMEKGVKVSPNNFVLQPNKQKSIVIELQDVSKASNIAWINITSLSKKDKVHKDKLKILLEIQKTST